AVTASTLPLSEADARPALFADDRPIEMTIEASFRSLCRHEGRECEGVPAVLVYADADGTLRRIGASIRARGKWRAERENCSVPPLFVTLVDDDGDSALLGAHPPVLPLTTHCREKPAAYEQYVVKEFLAYRLYGLLTD